MHQNLSLPIDYMIYIAKGCFVTLEYSLLSVFFGLIIGIVLSICKVSNRFIARFFADVYTSIFRGTPLLIQLGIIFFGLPSIIGVKLYPLTAGVIAFSLNSGAYVSEIIRAGINSIDKGQFDAAKSLGISSYRTMIDIILPQAIRNILPSLVNELTNLIKESAIISLIGANDLRQRADFVAHQTYDYFTPMIIAALYYYILVFIAGSAGRFLESRLKLQ
ncbi:MAG: amino acid ABC transporter permease [Rickettsiaceae bacterium]